MVNTGARRSEIIGLLPSHIDLSSPIPTMRITAEGRVLTNLPSERTIPKTSLSLEAGVVNQNDFMRYHARSLDCAACPLKPRCFPNTPGRKVSRSIQEGARDTAREVTASEVFAVSSALCKKIDRLFAHFKRILGLHRPACQGQMVPANTSISQRRLRTSESLPS